MKALSGKFPRRAVLLGALAIWAPCAAADETAADNVARRPGSLSVIDLAPVPALSHPSREEGSVDFAPTGATSSGTAPRDGSANPKGTQLDLSPPRATRAEPPLATFSALPDMPAGAAPPHPEVSSAPTPSPAPSVEIPANAAAPVKPAEAEKPADAATSATTMAPPAASAAPAAPTPDIAGLLRVALEGMVSQTPIPRPAGAADWKAAREAIRDFYAAREDAPIWVGAGGLTAAGRSLLSRLKQADEDGLDLSGFALPEGALSDAAPARLAQVEATLSAAAVAYALQASGGRIAPTSISRLITAKPQVADPAKTLADIAAAADPGAGLRAYNPPQKGYADLRAALARLRDLAPIASGAPKGPTLRIGMSDERVPLIRAKFGLGAQPTPQAAQVYDARVASAVASFQRTHGIAANGALTSATEDALFADPVARRRDLILANMEMWRWEPRDMGRLRVEVNVPDYSLHVMNDDAEVHRTRVIVGKPDTPTPIFSNAIRYLLINPAWHVPESIIKKEMAPRLANDPSYLERRGFKVTYIGNHLVVEQPPGEGNALGRILFMFPNEHSVYLHDTPQRGLFATPRRAYSHGCVRVEGPAQLAEIVMGGSSQGWTAARVQSMVGSAEHTIPLAHPVPIHIEYFTAFVDGAGELQEREDIYGISTRVAATLFHLRQD